MFYSAVKQEILCLLVLSGLSGEFFKRISNVILKQSSLKECHKDSQMSTLFQVWTVVVKGNTENCFRRIHVCLSIKNLACLYVSINY